MKLSDCKGDWALITGASSGIGREFAIRLAAAGLNLVLVARRGDLLEHLARDLRVICKIQTLVIAQDLTTGDAIDMVKQRVAEQDIKIRLLCNNAGIGHWGKFEDAPENRNTEMIALNITALVSACQNFLPDLSSHPTSAIINVSSPAAYQPVPYMAVYAATKSFVQNFSQALYGEYASSGVYVQTLIPAPTATEFDTIAGAYPSAVIGRGSATDVVAASLRNLEAKSPVTGNAKGVFKQRLFAGLFPHKFIIKEVSKIFKPPERH